MTDPFQMSPDGVNGYAVTVDDHAGHVVTVSVPPSLMSAAMSQNSGQATAALHALTEMIGAAMGRELSGMSENTQVGTNKLVTQDEQNSSQIAGVHGGLGDAVKLGDILTPLGQLGSGGMQAFSAGISALTTPLGTLASGATQGLTGILGQATGSITKNANIGGVPSVDINGDGKSGDAIGSGTVTRPMSGGASSLGASLTGSNPNSDQQRPTDHDKDQQVTIPAGSAMPFGSSGIGGGAAQGGPNKVVTVTKRVVTKQDQERSEA